MFDINKTINDLAIAHPDSYRIFAKYNIDFCCGGKRELAVVCKEQNIDPETVLAELSDLTQKTDKDTDWTALNQTELVAHIISRHHDYLREDLPRLHQLAEKVACVHGGRDPHLLEVLEVFVKLATELLNHLQREERILFPLIIAAEQNLDQVTPQLARPLEGMEAEHEEAGSDFARLAVLTGNYHIKPGMCNSYQALYKGLEALDQDTKLHIHKENNLLFPRAQETLLKISSA